METFSLQDALMILGGCIALGLVSAFGPWIWTQLRAAPRWMSLGVKRSPESDQIVMSRSEYETIVRSLSSQDGQSDGRTDSLVYERSDLLTFYTFLRKLGASREEARPILKAMRIPLSNDVWAAAAPPETYITPIAGRLTSATFEQDPELKFEQPPA